VLHLSTARVAFQNFYRQHTAWPSRQRYDERYESRISLFCVLAVCGVQPPRALSALKSRSTDGVRTEDRGDSPQPPSRNPHSPCDRTVGEWGAWPSGRGAGAAAMSLAQPQRGVRRLYRPPYHREQLSAYAVCLSAKRARRPTVDAAAAGVLTMPLATLALSPAGPVA
jgi:hypothetical protein